MVRKKGGSDAVVPRGDKKGSPRAKKSSPVKDKKPPRPPAKGSSPASKKGSPRAPVPPINKGSDKKGVRKTPKSRAVKMAASRGGSAGCKRAHGYRSGGCPEEMLPPNETAKVSMPDMVAMTASEVLGTIRMNL